MNSKEIAVVSGHTTWLSCKNSLAEILVTHQEDDNKIDLNHVLGTTYQDSQFESLRLEQDEESSPCIITVKCTPKCGAVITSLLVVSEARTIEVYSITGDYCGTCRGKEDTEWHTDSATDKRRFFRSYLTLESPATACEIKLLSLGGHTSVHVARVVVGIRTLKMEHNTPNGPGINLQTVQTMMEEMGTTLSPGAQSLLDLVQHQQKNEADILGGFLPMFLGGSRTLVGLAEGGAHEVADSNSSPSDPGKAELTTEDVPQTALHPLPATINHSKVTDMLSALLSGQPGHCVPGPDLLPMLQSVCGQVTQLRLDTTTGALEGQSNGPEEPREQHVCCGALETLLERRLDEMEKRLKEHMDLRLDALQQRLELALQKALTQNSHSLPNSH